eukprot:TRINITY_DN1150_c0_g1_i2.p1 TRINITY_DN1150_c0_g1~~TRINITY_DN1150_c0_g1_i2.p1  ORF type:complete len:252 (-),score=24.17 TRINITY_DN1150_c0_g1_i2:375-1130(-)
MPPKHNPQFTLPLELIGEILQPLSIWDLGRCERVSRDWQAACRDIWLQLAKRLLVSTDLPFAELKMQVHGATNKTTSYAFGRWILTFEPGVSITIQHIKFQLGICYRVRAPPHSHAVDPEDIEILIQTKLGVQRLYNSQCSHVVGAKLPLPRAFRPRVSRDITETCHLPNTSCMLVGHSASQYDSYMCDFDCLGQRLKLGQFALQIVSAQMHAVVYKEKDVLMVPVARRVRGCVSANDDPGEVLAATLQQS